jgi:hypothetical protein
VTISIGVELFLLAFGAFGRHCSTTPSSALASTLIYLAVLVLTRRNSPWGMASAAAYRRPGSASRRRDEKIYEKTSAAGRIRAAAEATRKLPFAFTLTARAESYLHGRFDLDDTIQRLQATTSTSMPLSRSGCARPTEELSPL